MTSAIVFGSNHFLKSRTELALCWTCLSVVVVQAASGAHDAPMVWSGARADHERRRDLSRSFEICRLCQLFFQHFLLRSPKTTLQGQYQVAKPFGCVRECWTSYRAVRHMIQSSQWSSCLLAWAMLSRMGFLQKDDLRWLETDNTPSMIFLGRAEHQLLLEETTVPGSFLWRIESLCCFSFREEFLRQVLPFPLKPSTHVVSNRTFQNWNNSFTADYLGNQLKLSHFNI